MLDAMHQLQHPSWHALGATASIRMKSPHMCSTSGRTELKVCRKGTLFQRRWRKMLPVQAEATGGDLEPEKPRLAQINAQLKQYGLAGVVSYGILNTTYYVGMFLFMWVVVLKVPRGLGAESAAKKFLEVMAMTWAGSQVTKLIRAGLALGMAPAVDAGLGKMCAALGLKGKDQAFAVVVACCLALALALFASVVTLWA